MDKTPSPNKVFYKIGEVASMLGVEPYVLRYWESEFNLRLTKSKNRQRLYQKKDIDHLDRIKVLLYDEKFTIAGARRRLKERKKNRPTREEQLSFELPPQGIETRLMRETLIELRGEVEALLRQL